MRKKIIAGNWKMNVKPSETAALVKGIAEATKDFTNVDIVCCTPAIDIPAAVAACAGTAVQPGAENAHWEARRRTRRSTSARPPSSRQASRR